MPTIPFFLAAASLALGLGLSSIPARAADAAASAPSAPAAGTSLKVGGKASGKRLTRDELRACLKQESELKTTGAQLEQAQATLDGERAEIQRLGATLEAERAQVDATSEAAVNAYNEKVKARLALVDAHNARLPAFNAQADQLDALRRSFTSGCADRPYDEADYFAIQRGK